MNIMNLQWIDNGACPPFHPNPAVTRVRPRRSVRLIPLLLAVLAGLTAFVYIGLHALIAWILTYPPVASLHSNPLAAKGLAYEDVSFPSADGRSLVNGWWIPAPAASYSGAGRAVVLSHGYGANREEYWVPMYDVAEWLHKRGFDVLMFDYGFADPQRRLPATGGVSEARQLLGAIRYARAAGAEKLVVWGFSMGAGTALLAALQDDSRAIDGMILDSTFLPTNETVGHNLAQYAPLKPSLPLIRLFLRFWSGTGLEHIPAEEALSTAFPFPIFLVHGTEDAKVPATLAEHVAGAQQHPDSRLWIVPGAIHEMMFRTHAEEYTRLAGDFLDRVTHDAAPVLVASYDGAADGDGDAQKSDAKAGHAPAGRH